MRKAGATTSSTLDCTYTYSDIDSNDTDSSTFAWSVKYSPVPGANSSSLASTFVGGDTVRCTVTANDGNTSGNDAFGEITIANTPPVVSNIALGPNPWWPANR